MSTPAALMSIFILLAFSAFFSASETAFSGLSRSRLQILAEGGNRRAAMTLEMSKDYDKLLSTILVGNNIVNIAMSSIATLWFTSILAHGGASVSTVVITIAVLLFGEITPKSLAKEIPEKMAMAVAPFLHLCVVILTPVNWLFSLWKKLMRKVFTVEDDRRVDGEELLAIVQEAEREGGIDDVESTLIQSAIEFGDHSAIDIATPRVDITAVPETADRETVAQAFNESGFSRLPVYRGSIDNIVGLLHQKDFLTHENWLEGVHAPLFVTETIDVGALLKLMQRRKCHMAVICDEFGGTAGIVSMEDVLEELVGEIWDEHDERDEPIVRDPDGSLSASGDLPLDDFLAELDLYTGEDFESASVSGWCMEMLGSIPQKGQSFTYQGFRIEITEASRRRVQRILATSIED